MAKNKVLSRDEIVALGKAVDAAGRDVDTKDDTQKKELKEDTVSARSTGAFRAALAAVIAGSYIALARVDTNIHTKMVIQAPAQDVWELLYKMDEWNAWNDVFSVTVGDGDGKDEVAIGKELGITCNWLDGTSDYSTERITTVDKGLRLCWDYEGMPEIFLSTDRCVTITQISTTNVMVDNYEVFGGPLAAIVTLTKGRNVASGFEAFNRALKIKAEGKEKTSK